ncbi:hypothetical protein FAUST_10684 [Fusarium austroamericanum]|uniref:Heterokaryon incompatibility domain-containing protein n=1 Tax=Fusarium austroamericanum TaxID=282268 RepID=A0AAN5Z1R4_FUSAU|nr:hypothetical protein FAUST_10684 [Fusarium austroamericanum]
MAGSSPRTNSISASTPLRQPQTSQNSSPYKRTPSPTLPSQRAAPSLRPLAIRNSLIVKPRKAIKSCIVVKPRTAIKNPTVADPILPNKSVTATSHTERRATEYRGPTATPSPVTLARLNAWIITEHAYSKILAQERQDIQKQIEFAEASIREHQGKIFEGREGKDSAKWRLPNTYGVPSLFRQGFNQSQSAKETMPELDQAVTELFAEDKWKYKNDTPFWKAMLPGLWQKLLPSYSPSLALCGQCQKIYLTTRLGSLTNFEETCILWTDQDFGLVHFLLSVQSDVRICAIPEEHNIQGLTLPLSHDEPGRSVRSVTIHPGLPTALDSGSDGHFNLIKGWVQLCDNEECSFPEGCRPKSDPGSREMPTRLIDVTKDDNRPDDEQRRPWRLTEDNRTTWKGGFEINKSSFSDAVEVTQALGIKYLWIDSFCIIQESDEFEAEAKKMEQVFKNAYLTIAATSAKNSSEGFLLRTHQSSYAELAVPLQGKIIVSNLVNNFPRHVLEGPLNKRAWVLQERALSRRIIHFTNTQTYWECGGGVRSETLGYMTNFHDIFCFHPSARLY